MKCRASKGPNFSFLLNRETRFYIRFCIWYPRYGIAKNILRQRAKWSAFHAFASPKSARDGLSNPPVLCERKVKLRECDLVSRSESFNHANRNPAFRGQGSVGKFPRSDPRDLGRGEGGNTRSSGSLFHVVCFQANRGEILTVPARSRGSRWWDETEWDETAAVTGGGGSVTDPPIDCTTIRRYGAGERAYMDARKRKRMAAYKEVSLFFFSGKYEFSCPLLLAIVIIVTVFHFCVCNGKYNLQSERLLGRGNAQSKVFSMKINR